MDKDSSPDALNPSPLDNLKVYVLHRDIDFEFGHVVGVFSTPEKAHQGFLEALKERDPSTNQLIYDREELSIEQWTLDEYLQHPTNTHKTIISTPKL